MSPWCLGVTNQDLEEFLRSADSLDIHDVNVDQLLQGEGEFGELGELLNADTITELVPCVEQDKSFNEQFSAIIRDDMRDNEKLIRAMLLKSIESAETTKVSSGNVSDVVELDNHIEAEVLTLFSSFSDVVVSPAGDSIDEENLVDLPDFYCEIQEHNVAICPGENSYQSADNGNDNTKNVGAKCGYSLDKNCVISREEVRDPPVKQNLTDSLEESKVALFISELEQARTIEATNQSMKLAPANIDSRVFVPTFSVRIEHSDDLNARPAIGFDSHMLVGPPKINVASREERVRRCKYKRRCRSGSTTKLPNPSLSSTRRASAAKRQRVIGRFVSEAPSFVSITALQK